ncbi:disease resistance protein RPS5-like [Telopea speciosissima]|uniref:disease resistance protein RPS5-like n=1 Tax=Telopea speciosissima TaxID=54955 RepID=UPI001CC6C8FF|nr:disease resistance protein RPS5-like [Telopea speciosissima]
MPPKGLLSAALSSKELKDAKRMIDEVKELLNEGRTFVFVSDPSPLLSLVLKSMQTLDFKVYDDSTKLAMDKITEALKDENINMVGVYGIGGVGKTTLMRELAKKLKKDGLFDQVVMVTVSQEPVFKKIQGEIAENWERIDTFSRRYGEPKKMQATFVSAKWNF